MKKVIKSLAVAIIILIMVTYSSISLATQSMSDLKDEQNSVKDEISDTKKEIEEIKEEKSETLEEVEELIQDISKYNDEISDLKSEISDLEKEITEKEEQIKEDEEEYAKEELAMQERLVAMYKNGDTSYLDYLFSSSDIIDFISSYYLVSQIAEYDTQMLEKIQTHKESIESQKNELEESKKKLESSKKTLESKQNALKVAKSEKEKYANKLSQQESELADTLEELVEYEKSISSKIAKLQKEYDEQLKKKQAAASSSSSSNTNNSSSSYGFGWPVSNPVLTTSYGVPGRYWSLGYHTGVDFRATVGTPVYSVGNGMVVTAGYSGAYGYHVIIYHGNNIYSLYAHASSLSVSSGQTVTKGQQIMLSGATGNVTGPHLHFEIRSPGSSFYNCVNPNSYLP